MKVDRYKVFMVPFKDLNDIAQEAQNLLVSGTLPAVNGRKNDLYTSMKILLAPVVQIKHFYEGHPRAYNAWPMVCHSPYQDGKVVIYSPVGYDGKFYVPPNGELVEGKKLENLEAGLFAGGWSDPAYIFIPKDVGTDLPVDYSPETSIHCLLNSGIQQPDRRYIFFKEREGSGIFDVLAEDGSLVQTFNNEGLVIETQLSEELAQSDWIDKVLGTNLGKPIINHHIGLTALAYRCDDVEAAAGFCPESFEPMSAAEYQWLEADRADIQLGIIPPPNPHRFGNKLSAPKAFSALPSYDMGSK